jgi:hypothetical protein
MATGRDAASTRVAGWSPRLGRDRGDSVLRTVPHGPVSLSSRSSKAHLHYPFPISVGYGVSDIINHSIHRGHSLHRTPGSVLREAWQLVALGGLHGYAAVSPTSGSHFGSTGTTSCLTN